MVQLHRSGHDNHVIPHGEAIRIQDYLLLIEDTNVTIGEWTLLFKNKFQGGRYSINS
jgi:hypothetical protein